MKVSCLFLLPAFLLLGTGKAADFDYSNPNKEWRRDYETCRAKTPGSKYQSPIDITTTDTCDSSEEYTLEDVSRRCVR